MDLLDKMLNFLAKGSSKSKSVVLYLFLNTQKKIQKLVAMYDSLQFQIFLLEYTSIGRGEYTWFNNLCIV